MTEHKKIQVFTVVLKVLFVAAVIAALVLGYYQIKGLKSRMTTAENRLNESTFYYDDSAKTDESSQPSYKIVSVKDANVKVEQSNGMETTYTPKAVKAYTIEVDNTTNYSIDVDTFSIRARTENGQLISPAYTDPSDPNYVAQPISLAPGGKTTFTLYYAPAKDQSFTGLYDSMQQKEIKQ
jgi:hypothetical protein